MTDTADPKDLRRLRRLAESLVPIVKAAGLGPDHVHSAINEAFDKFADIPFARPIDASVDPEYVRCIGGMLSLWRSDKDYVDSMGNYLPLPLTGPDRSMTTLFENWRARQPEGAGQVSVQTILDLCIKHDAVSLVDDARYIRVLSWFRINGNETIVPGALLEYLSRFAGTVCYSLNQEGRPYFMAHVSRFPNEKLPLLNNKVTKEGLSTVENFDSFLEGANRPPDTAEETSHVGVGLFMFCEDSD